MRDPHAGAAQLWAAAEPCHIPGCTRRAVVLWQSNVDRDDWACLCEPCWQTARIVEGHAVTMGR